jgi:hypothetical protein
MAEKRTLTVTIRITGLRETLRATKNWPDDAQKEIRAASLSIAGAVAVDIRTAARTNGQSALLAPTVRAVKDRVPSVQAGGARRVGRNRVPAYKVLFGSEFGAVTLRQYRAFQSGGYWFFKTVEADTDYISSEWLDAIDDVNRRWGL